MSTVTVEAHRKRFNVRAAPMQPLSAVVADVLGQLNLAGVRPEDCRLLLKGKPLDLATPLRFANVGRDKLELHTGREPVLGVQEAARPAAPQPPVAAPVAAAPTASSIPSPAPAQPVSQATASQQVAAPSHGAAPAPAPPPTQPLGSTTIAPAASQATAAPGAAAAGPSGSSDPAAPGTAAADACHPSVQLFGQRVHVFTRTAEQQAEGGLAAAQELDDSFYEFTEADLRRAMASQASQRAQQEGGHLMTAAMREREERRRAEAYGSVPIRLYLPDGAHCLQTCLPATEQLSRVLALARAALAPQAAAAAYLFTTPPRTVLRDRELGQSLYAAKMVPAAKVHVGVDAARLPPGAQLVRREVAALAEAPPQRAAVMHRNAASGGQQAAPQAGEASRAAGGGGAARVATQAGGSSAKGVPKWLRLSK